MDSKKMRADKMERFTKRSKLILSLAEEDARRFQQNEIGTESVYVKEKITG